MCRFKSSCFYAVNARPCEQKSCAIATPNLCFSAAPVWTAPWTSRVLRTPMVRAAVPLLRVGFELCDGQLRRTRISSRTALSLPMSASTSLTTWLVLLPYRRSTFFGSSTCGGRSRARLWTPLCCCGQPSVSRRHTALSRSIAHSKLTQQSRMVKAESCTALCVAALRSRQQSCTHRSTGMEPAAAHQLGLPRFEDAPSALRLRLHQPGLWARRLGFPFDGGGSGRFRHRNDAG